MNFLSHYFLLPEQSHGDIIVGNLLPDLMRGFSKIYRQNIKSRKAIQHLDHVKGMHFHMHTDKLFHKHPFFESYCDLLKKEITRHKLPSQRSYIVSHVMLELLIDQYLVEHYEEMANEFYLKLEYALRNSMEQKIKMTLNQQNTSRIISIFRSFTENRYAFSLVEWNGVQNALYHIVGRRIGIHFNDSNWNKMIEDGRIQMDKELPIFLKELKEELNDA